MFILYLCGSHDFTFLGKSSFNTWLLLETSQQEEENEGGDTKRAAQGDACRPASRPAQSRRGLGATGTSRDAGTSGFSPLALEASSYAFSPEPALSKPVASSLEGVSISIVSRE